MERHTSSLDDLVDTLRRRYGSRAAARGDRLPPPAQPLTLPTGVPELDAALPGGGLPRGGLTELIAARSAGGTSLAMRVVAQAQRGGAWACWLDLGRSFTPGAAQAAGIDLGALAVARPASGAETAVVVRTLLARRAVGALVIDSLPRWAAMEGGAAALGDLLRQLPRLLEGSGCALLALNPLPSGLLPDPACAPGHTLGPVAALRLRLAHAGWLRAGPAIVGCAARIDIRLPPFAEPSAVVAVALGFAGEERAQRA
jgi:recombination protein RecA